MNYRIPGLSSIILVFLALAIADYQLFTISAVSGAVYLVCIPVAFLFTLYNYCRKCPHVESKTCRHVLFGWVTRRLFKPATPSKYMVGQILLALLPLVIIFAVPQYWLFQNISLFIVFWVLMLVAVIILRLGVCTGCKNINCAFCPNCK